MDKKSSHYKVIVGALRSTIHAHGPIDATFIESAAKRIWQGIGPDIEEGLEAEKLIGELLDDLGDINSQLRGLPESVLTGEHGLAAATMRAADAYEVALADFHRIAELATQQHDCPATGHGSALAEIENIARSHLGVTQVPWNTAEEYIAKLKAALEPFARYVQELDPAIPDLARVAYAPERIASDKEPKAGDFRRAAEVLH